MSLNAGAAISEEEILGVRAAEAAELLMFDFVEMDNLDPPLETETKRLGQRCSIGAPRSGEK